jgi:hypothetical protein
VSTLSDFVAECDDDMAQEYSDADSLKCSSHIVVNAVKVSDTEDAGIFSGIKKEGAAALFEPE